MRRPGAYQSPRQNSEQPKRQTNPYWRFIQQVDAREEYQQAFLSEIEAYQGGVFRASFTSALELNNEITKALRQIETMRQAITEDAFKARIKNVLENRHRHQEEPILIGWLSFRRSAWWMLSPLNTIWTRNLACSARRV